jgi:hypothetical protein
MNGAMPRWNWDAQLRNRTSLVWRRAWAYLAQVPMARNWFGPKLTRDMLRRPPPRAPARGPAAAARSARRRWRASSVINSAGGESSTNSSPSLISMSVGGRCKMRS